ncbi:MAG TPA: hypothetical protein PK467_12155 [Candidatus Wallbacteria bacterium]|nr:hypothetical protein [Candidatus Wallbacteria bacterium]
MDLKNTIKITRTRTIPSNSAAIGAKKINKRFTSPAEIFMAVFAAVVLMAAPLWAAMTACQHCKKNVDDQNSVCPYCLGDLSAPAVTGSQAANVKSGARSSAAADAAAGEERGAGDEAVIITELQVKAFLEDPILKSFHANYAGQKITLENVRRDDSNNAMFKITGTAFNSRNKPLDTVGKLISLLDEQAAIVQTYLNHAAKVDINDPTLVNYTITLKIDSKNKAFSKLTKASQPLEFTFMVPPSKTETVNVKILKINADSESVLYDMQNKSGDKVSLNLIAEGGMRIVVMIDGKVAYEKKY